MKTQKEKHRLYEKVSNYNLKKRILKHYGTECISCGITEQELLCISQEFKNPGIDTHTFWRSIVRNNYPERVKVVCRNCSFMKKRFGVYPSS
jgi:hypothetical protein